MKSLSKIAVFATASAFALTGCTTVDDLATDRVGQTTLHFANGLPAGTVQLLSNGQSVTVAVAASAMYGCFG